MDRETWWNSYQKSIEDHEKKKELLRKGELIEVDAGGKTIYEKAPQEEKTLKEAFDEELLKRMAANPPEIPTYEEFSKMIDDHLNSRFFEDPTERRRFNRVLDETIRGFESEARCYGWLDEPEYQEVIDFLENKKK